MRIEKKCKTCNTDFIAIKTTQKFCKRSCFKKAYYQKNKEKLRQEELNPVYPKRICAYCNNESDITFDPIIFPKKYGELRCPFCNVPTSIIWKFDDTPNSFQKITEFFGTIVINNSNLPS